MEKEAGITLEKYNNIQLTDHFTLYEFIEAKMPCEAIAMNWRHFKDDDVSIWKSLAEDLEKMRLLVNDNFTSDIGFKQIGIRIEAGYRCKEWELFRGRTGNSQHTICAADIKPINCTREMTVKILHWIFSKYNEYWKGGLALKSPSKEGKILLTGFLHIDKRGKRARWSYD